MLPPALLGISGATVLNDLKGKVVVLGDEEMHAVYSWIQVHWLHVKSVVRKTAGR